MRTGVLTSSRLLVDGLQEGGFRYRAAMVTLTYASDQPWEANDVRGYVDRAAQWLKRRGERLRGVWVVELTQAGRPHYHLVLLLPRGLTLPKADKAGWWVKGSSRMEWARRPIAYLTKYASKGGFGHSLPKGCRLWASVGLDGSQREALRWWLAPSWLRGFSTVGDVLRRVPGWWENRTLGIAYRSPWVLDSVSGGRPTFLYLGWREEDVRFFKPCGA